MTHTYLFSEYSLDCRARELRFRGDVVAMPARVLECLQYLIEHRDRAVGRDELMVAVFARDNVSDAQLSQVVLRARRTVGDDGQEQRMIRTVPRFGFRWVAPTEEMAELAGAAAPDHRPHGAAPAESSRGNAGSGLPGPVGSTAHSVPARRRRWILVLLATLAVLLTAGAWWARSDRVQLLAAATGEGVGRNLAVVVLPTEVAGNGEAAWARLGLMDFLGSRLRRGGLPVASSESVVSLLHGQNGAGDAQYVLRRIIGEGWIVSSVAQSGQAGWRVELSATDAEGLVRHAAAEHADMIKAADQAAGRLLAALGRTDRGSGVDLSLAERLQRAQAALLGNELDTARRILESAPPGQVDDPELVLRRAQVEHRAGHQGRARELIATVLDSPRAAEVPELRARALVLRGAVCVRLDCHAQGERDYSRAAAMVDAAAQPALLGEALNGRGVTRSMLGRFEEALEDLGRARVLLARSGDMLSVARVDANLGFLERLRGRPSQALEHMGRTVEAFRRFGAVHELVAMHVALAETHLQLLQPGQAQASIDLAWEMRHRITDETQLTGVALARAEVLVRRGRFAQARAMLDEHGDGPVLPANLHRAESLRAELAWRAGRPRRAVEVADAVLEHWQHGRARPERLLRLRLLRAQAALEAGMQAGEPQPEAIEPGADALAWRYLLTAVEAQLRQDHARTGPAYRVAVAHAERDGVPEEVAATIMAYAAWALERGALDEAASMVGRIAPWSGEDFDLALLQVRLYHALGQADAWAQALQDARRMAGERQVPPRLLLPPAA